ncbi:MAG: DUF1456 family protein [Pseudomonadales bacterium]|nr:DUF1456 family protein [Pseudomonadales bacterium]
MNTNDILRRIRYVYNFDDSRMIALFGLGQLKVSRAQVSDWLKKDDADNFEVCLDEQLAAFLNGLIIDKRGKKPGVEPVAETTLTNNMVLMKLKIALDLKAEDVLQLLDMADFRLGKSELSAFFRKPGHKHYRKCQDQVLRNFLQGMQLRYRDA